MNDISTLTISEAMKEAEREGRNYSPVFKARFYSDGTTKAFIYYEEEESLYSLIEKGDKEGVRRMEREARAGKTIRIM
jgi:hypothetical protein